MKQIVVLSLISAFFLAHGQGSTNRTDEIYLGYFNSLTSKVDRYWHDGMFEECITILRLQTTLDPADMEAKRNLEWMLENVGRFADGITVSTQFALEAPSNEEVVDLHAYVFYNLKLFDRVAAILEPMIERATRRNIYVMLVESYEQMGLLREALRVLELRRIKFPNDPSIDMNKKRLEDKLAGKIPLKPPPPKRARTPQSQGEGDRMSRAIEA